MPKTVTVALRKESVDRNFCVKLLLQLTMLSLSARRAWIEISYIIVYAKERGSLSARRAWIEIWLFGLLRMFASVALRKESVDRNIMYLLTASGFFMSLSARRAWIEI